MKYNIPDPISLVRKWGFTGLLNNVKYEYLEAAVLCLERNAIDACSGRSYKENFNDCIEHFTK